MRESLVFRMHGDAVVNGALVGDFAELGLSIISLALRSLPRLRYNDTIRLDPPFEPS